MNWWIEGIAILGGALIYGAMAFKKLLIIKILLLAGAIAFLAYGIILWLPALIIVNAVGVGIGIYGLVSAIRSRKNGQKVQS
jgi:hypothetical protein